MIVQANAKNDLPVRIAMGNGVLDWSVAVDADGPIKTATDLKGKTIGVFSLATGGIAYFNSYLRANGLDPAKDVDLRRLAWARRLSRRCGPARCRDCWSWASAIAATRTPA